MQLRLLRRARTTLRNPRAAGRVAIQRAEGARDLVVRRLRPDPRMAWPPELKLLPASNTKESDRSTLEAFLTRRGAEGVEHAAGSLFDHLVGTERMLAAWGQPRDVQLAGLFHSAYSYGGPEASLLSAADDRPEVRTLIGSRAELLAFVFGTVDRRKLKAVVAARSSIPPEGLDGVNRWTAQRRRLSAALVAAVLVIDAANGMDIWESKAEGTSSPFPGLSIGLHRAAPYLEVVPPIFRECQLEIDPRTTEEPLRLYNRATGGQVSEIAEVHRMLLECANRLPWWGEPWVLLAEDALAMGDDDAHRLAEKGLSLLRKMGAAWDTRSSFEEWGARASRVLDQTTGS